MNTKGYNNMRIKNTAMGMLTSLLILGSCSTPKNITYFQDMSNGDSVKLQQANKIKVQPEDKLSITVNTQDAALSSLFNLGQTVSNTSVGSSNNGLTSNSAYYTVDSNGDINFPVLGTLHVSGLTREEIASFVENQLIANELVKQPIVTVEFGNTGVSILGSVSSPGRYEFNADHITILDAISMAGDLAIDGKRENILVLRDNNGQKESYTVDLTDTKSLVQSPVYYLQQNDVVYVEPNDKSKRESTTIGNSLLTPTFWLSAISSALSIATLIVTLTR